jgi:hypothetical protein
MPPLAPMQPMRLMPLMPLMPPMPRSRARWQRVPAALLAAAARGVVRPCRRAG